MRIAFVYSPGRRARLTELATGEVASEFFYGAAELAAEGHEVAHFELRDEKVPPFLPTAIDLLRRAGLTPPKTDGWNLLQAWALAPRLRAFDCIVATQGSHAFALQICAALGRMRVPVIAIQCGLLHQRYNPARRAITRALLNRMHSIFFGEAELAPTLQAFGVEPTRMAAGHFGVDTRFWTPGGARENFVLAIGNDTRRDYTTLLAAAGEIGAKIHIVTRLAIPEPRPANVTVTRGSWHEQALTDAQIRDLYRRAACVVVPLQDTLQPSGQSVTLQAMACGAPVVLTRTRGLWDPVALRDGENIRLVAPAQPTALAKGVREILDDPTFARRLSEAGRASVLERGDIRSFATQIGALCARAVATQATR